MAREWLATQDKSNLVLERVPPGRPSRTGFVQVIQVGKYFQPRLQIKGEGKGGVRKRGSGRSTRCRLSPEPRPGQGS